MTTQLIPPIRENMFLTGNILSPPWVRFFIDVGKVLATATSDIEDEEYKSLFDSGDNPTFEERISSLETELETMMEQLNTVITKMSETYRLIEEVNMQLIISNNLLLVIANVNSVLPEKFEDLRDLM